MRLRSLFAGLGSSQRTTIGLLGVYLVLSLLMFGYFRYVGYKDEVTMIAMAEKFARGDFLQAANAYWAPLLPLFIAVFIGLGAPTIVAAKVALIVIGALAFLAVRALTVRFDMSEPLRALVLVLAVPVLLYYTFFAVMPDLTLTAVLLWYFSVIFDPRYPDRRGAGWICGLLGAAAYLTKGFGFPFFLIHFTSSTIAHAVLNSPEARRKVLGHVGRGLLVFGCVSLVWGYMLNRKYRDPVVWVGIAGPYNQATRGPDYYDPVLAPTAKSGFVQPWPGDVSIAQEPYYFLKRVKSWTPFESRKAIKHQAMLTRTAMSNIVYIYQSYSPFSFVILIGSLLLIRGVPRKDSEHFGLAAALATLALYTSFYTVTHAEVHYLFPMGLLVLLMGGTVLNALLQSSLMLGAFRKTVIVLLFAVSFSRYPIEQLVARMYSGRDLARIAQRLRSNGVGGRLASNGDYGASVVVAYHLGATYYGHPKRGMTQPETISELRRHQIRYYLAWSERTPLPDSVVRRIDAVEEGGRRLTLYQVQPAQAVSQ